MKEFYAWAGDLADYLSDRIDHGTVPGLEHSTWMNNKQERPEPEPEMRVDLAVQQEPIDGWDWHTTKAIFNFPHTEDFYDYCEWNTGSHEWVAPCIVCQKDAPIECEPWEFIHDSHYCGRSQSCCP